MLAAGPWAPGDDGDGVAALEEAVGRGGDVLVVNRALEEGGGGLVVAAAEEEDLRARDEACDGGVLDRKPL